jgi:hypothetical protein
MDLVDFLDLHGIRWCPLASLKQKEGLLPSRPYTECINELDWRTMRLLNLFNLLDDDQLEELQQEQSEYIVIDTTNIHQIDIDDKESDIHLDTPYFLSCRKQLPHFFTIFDSKGAFFGTLKEKAGDYLSGIGSYAIRDSKVYNFMTPILKINIDEYKCLTGFQSLLSK